MRNTLLILITLSLFSCKKEEKDPDIDDPIEVVDESSKLIICNEGNFGWGNATISQYDIENQSISDSVYFKANEYGLGDICQSATFFNNKLYVVVNNSAKVEVVNSSTYESISTISGLNSPRYLLPITSDKMYVSDLYADEISVVNLNTNKVSKTIKCSGWTEEMAKKGDKAYVTNSEREYVYVIDFNKDSIVDSISVGTGVSSILADTTWSLWCLRSNDNPALLRINEDKSVSEFLLEPSSSPSKLRYDKINHSLYFINGNIEQFDISSESFTIDFIVNNSNVFYGLGVEPTTGNVYVSDAKDFVKNSTIYVYTYKGELKHSFESGINTGFFLFGN